MSLTSYVSERETAVLVDRVIPDNLSRPSGPLLVPPKTENYSKVGTAFDYMLRLELSRRCPHALTEAWVAESAVSQLEWHLKIQQSSLGDVVSFRQRLTPETVETAKAILSQARSFAEEYRDLEKPKTAHYRILARHTLLLANLDPIFRAGYSGWDLEEADQGDIDDLINLFEIVPYKSLTNPDTMHLNPTFGWGSKLVNGADADLVIGNTLIDIKTTKNLRLERSLLRQLIGYYILAEIAQAEDPDFPVVESLGAYFSRYGKLWTFPAKDFATNPAFWGVKRDFIHGALEKGHGVLLLHRAESEGNLAAWLQEELGPEAIESLRNQWKDDLERLRSKSSQSPE